MLIQGEESFTPPVTDGTNRQHRRPPGVAVVLLPKRCVGVKGAGSCSLRCLVEVCRVSINVKAPLIITLDDQFIGGLMYCG